MFSCGVRQLYVQNKLEENLWCLWYLIHQYPELPPYILHIYKL